MLKPILTLSALVACACISTPSETTSTNGVGIFRAMRCADCHGSDLSGSHSGPSLEGLSANWTRDALASFLADPEAVVSKNARLSALGAEYKKDMPAFGDLTDAQRDALAGWLLTK